MNFHLDPIRAHQILPHRQALMLAVAVGSLARMITTTTTSITIGEWVAARD